MNIIKLFSVMVLVVLLVGCGSSELLISNSATNIKIDGNQEDWEGKLTFLEDEKVALGFLNDDENLYFCLASADKATVMKIMSLGLTVWFEPENGEATGLQYPKRMDQVSPRGLMGMNREKRNKSDFDVTVNTMMQNQGEYAVLDEDEEILYVAPIGSNDGFELKAGAANQQFVYEAKIPIGNNPLAQIPINIFPNEKITIRFQSGEIDMDEMRKNGGMQGGGSGMRGGGGGMSGGGMQGGGRGRQPGGMKVDRVNFDVDVKLSK